MLPHDPVCFKDLTYTSWDVVDIIPKLQRKLSGSQHHPIKHATICPVVSIPGLFEFLQSLVCLQFIFDIGSIPDRFFSQITSFHTGLLPDCNAVQTLKTKDRQFDNFVVIGGTVSCHYDNSRCHQLRQSCRIDDLLFSAKAVPYIHGKLVKNEVDTPKVPHLMTLIMCAYIKNSIIV